MALHRLGDILLPEHEKPGGFDHAAVHRGASRLYVAHTANDALDVIDCAGDRYLHSVAGLPGVAGALVSEELNLIFTSNRGENTVGIFAPHDEAGPVKVPVGVRPNGLALDPRRGLLLAANVGDPGIPGSCTLSMVDVRRRARRFEIPAPGRTRWAVFDDAADAFYVNIADPAQVVVVAGADPERIARTIPVPAAGPHGLDLDGERRRLFCACDARRLVVIDLPSGAASGSLDLGGAPDVIFFNAALGHLYVASGDPGLIEVFDTEGLRRIESVPTEPGAHTLGFDAARSKVYAFLPQSHAARVFLDEG